MGNNCMRRIFCVPALALVLSTCVPALSLHGQETASGDQPHTPAAGTAERKAILDALREDMKANFEGHKLVFKVLYLKVHNGWAWVDVTPLDEKGNALAEGGPNLMRSENGNWKVMDLSKVKDDPNDPLGPEEASPGYIKNLRKVYPDVPTDIFPSSRKGKGKTGGEG